MSDYNEVSKRAYELWEKAGKPGGRDRDYWFAAEKEIQEQPEQSSGGQKKTTGRVLQSPRGAKRLAGTTQGRE